LPIPTKATLIFSTICGFASFECFKVYMIL